MSRLTRLFRRRSLDRELAGEIEAYVAERADELVEQGLSREHAIAAARRQFGNAVTVLEDSREVWFFMPIENALRDMRIGVRALRRNPLFTLVAAVTLALGIGANTAIFSIIDAVLLRPLPIPDANRVVVLWEHPPKSITTSAHALDNQNPVSPINFLDWRDRTRSFEAMAAIAWFPKGLSGAGEPREVDGLDVSAAFFRVLGTPPLMGRTFTDKEDVPNGPKLVVLSYGLWRQQFGADRGILGRTIRLMDEPYTVIGVMPEGFDLPFLHAELWTPAQIDRTSQSLEGRYLDVIAKLKPGVTIAQADSDLSAVARQIARERPMTNRGWGAGAMSLYDETTGDVRKALLVLFGAVTFVLLIATANVANLLLMRGTQRRREIAVRAAIGASRGRIAAQLLAESFLLSVGGAVLGVALAFVGLRAIVTSAPALALPRIDGVHVDVRVLAFSAALCLATTFLFGLAPALSFSRRDPDDALKQSGVRNTGRGGLRTRRLLVGTEVALSLVLLIGAGLLARSFLNQIRVDRGFRTDHILTMRMFFAGPQYQNKTRRAEYLAQIVDRVRALPGVQAASSAHFLPMTGSVSGSCYTRADRPEPAPGLQPSADFLIISPEYFTTMGIPFVAGRDFNAHDTVSTEPAVIVNRAFVRHEFPNENPIGKPLNLCWNVTHGVIVGVVADARHAELSVEPHPTIFLDNHQTPMYFGALVVRTALPPAGVARAVQDIIHSADPDQAVSHVETMDQVVAESVARPRLESALLGIFAAIALLLASIGLYGVLAYSVTQRTREIGIRMALGADAEQLVKNVVRDGLLLMTPGILAGAAAALALTRLMGSMLYGVTPADPVTFASVCAVLIAVGLLASWLPARRAAAVDPIGSLRWE